MFRRITQQYKVRIRKSTCYVIYFQNFGKNLGICNVLLFCFTTKHFIKCLQYFFKNLTCIIHFSQNTCFFNSSNIILCLPRVNHILYFFRKCAQFLYVYRRIQRLNFFFVCCKRIYRLNFFLKKIHTRARHIQLICKFTRYAWEQLIFIQKTLRKEMSNLKRRYNKTFISG